MNTLSDEQLQRLLELLRSGKSLRRIENETGHRRETIAAYGRRAGLIGGSSVASLDARRNPASMFDAHAVRIAQALDAGRSLRDIHSELVRDFGLCGTYSALKRFIRVRPGVRGAQMLAA